MLGVLLIDSEFLVGLHHALMLLAQLSQRHRFRRHLAAETVPAYLGVLKDMVREFFVGGQKPNDVIFGGEFGMQFRRVVRCAHEGQQEVKLFQVAGTQRASEGHLRLRCVPGLEKDVRRTRTEPALPGYRTPGKK